MFGNSFEREITKDQYDRAVANRGYLTKEDYEAVMTDAERLGYGGTTGSVFEDNGKYFVHCHVYDSCD